jgi:hypothetical protein
MGGRVVTARDALARAAALGVELRLEADGQVRITADAPPPADLLAELRERRDEVVRLLANGRRPAWSDAAPQPARRVYQPGDPDPLRDGLLASARRHLPPLPSAARGTGVTCADGEQ